MKSRITTTLMMLMLMFQMTNAQKFIANERTLCIESMSPAQQYPTATNCRMYVDDFEIEVGQSKKVIVYMDNDMPIWLMQLQMTLPDGFSVTKAKFTDDFVAATSYTDQSGTHNDNAMTYSWEGENPHELRLLTTNLQLKHSIPAGTRQSVFELTVKASETMATGSYTMATTLFRLVAATTPEGEGYNGVNTTCQVQVLPPRATEISVIPSEQSLLIGSSVTLQATVLPAYVTQVVEWRSSDSQVATVDSQGKVVAIGVGQATITATTTESAQLTATCAITVNPILAQSLAIDRHSAQVKRCEQFTLTATVGPANTTNSTVTWHSTDTSVATVDNQGNVTVMGLGSAVVTATTTDGTQLRSSCLVVVDNKPDVNSDTEIDVMDVNLCVNAMLGRLSDPDIMHCADVDGNGSVDVSDINLIVNAVLYGQRPATYTITVGDATLTLVPVSGNDDVVDFAIGQTEVTDQFFEAVMGYSSYRYHDDGHPEWNPQPKWPATDIPQYTALEFIDRLNQLTGLGFRLPEFIEWKFAASGGNRSHGYTYSGSNDIDLVAWWEGNSGGTPHPVATKAPNELGLYDMSGNLSEWSDDTIYRHETYEYIYFGGSYESLPQENQVDSFTFYDMYHIRHFFTLGIRVAM